MIKSNNEVHFNSGETIDSLPLGIYKIVQTMTGTYLSKLPNYEYKKMFGISNDYVNLLLEHTTKSNSFGALFSGLSGMGKTQTIKNFIIKSKIPTIFVDQGLSGNVIIDVINRINSDVIVFFDEFEKLYVEENSSNTLLTFLDGIDFGKKVITICSFNNKHTLSNYFFNRPGRFIFDFKFNRLEPEEGLEFINSIIDISMKKELLNYLGKIKNLSYDICNSIVGVIKIHGINNFIKFSDCLNIQEESFIYFYTLTKHNKPHFETGKSATIPYAGIKFIDDNGIIFYYYPSDSLCEILKNDINYDTKVVINSERLINELLEHITRSNIEKIENDAIYVIDNLIKDIKNDVYKLYLEKIYVYNNVSSKFTF